MAKINKVFLDFEFNDTAEKDLNLVSCVLKINDEEPVKYWLHGNIKRQLQLSHSIKELIKEDYTFVAFAAIAEARAIMSLPDAPDLRGTKWIDLWLEYRCLGNHSNKIAYGKQLIEGKVKNTFPSKPFWMGGNDEGENNQKGEQNYSAACFKLLDVIIDTDRKEKVRDLIIRGKPEEIEEAKEEILDYNEDDVLYLPKLLQASYKIYKKRYPKSLHKNILGWMYGRGDYAIRTSIMERDGYPINYDATKNFSDNVGSILGEVQAEVNELFPDVAPFRYDLRKGTYTWNQVATREWIDTLPFADRWPKTDTGKHSLSVDAFTKFFNYSHTFPKDNLGAQFVRFLKTKQHCNGFSANRQKKTLWDNVGRDKRVRPYMNIFRSQSSRSQPSSTSFMFLKAAWMRALCQPDENMAMGGIDWKSQEVLIAAYESGDKKLEEAYFSGDVYLWFGKACGKIPKDATRETHEPMRDRFKSSVLGIMYLMGAESLAIKIANDTGEPCSVDEAQEYIDMFDEIFHVFADFREDVFLDYKDRGYLMLKDGWTMWGDNYNHRSIKNCVIQGGGAVCMRKAVAFAQDAGLKIPFTLHDALYIECGVKSVIKNMEILADCMNKAFEDSYPGRRPCLLEGSIWSPNYADKDQYIEIEGLTGEVKKQQIYIDKRGREEYEQFSKWFKRDDVLDLL